MTDPASTLALYRPAELLLHEDVQPPRIQRLLRAIESSQTLENPVLVARTDHGVMVLDGAHRTTALRELAVPRLLVHEVDPALVARPGAWTHVVDHHQPQARRQLAELEQAHDGSAGPLVATVRMPGHQFSVRARSTDPSDARDVIRAVAGTYQGDPYRRTPGPEELGEDQTQVTYVVPPLAQIVRAAADGGRFPAGVTRFWVEPRVPHQAVAVGLAELRAADVGPGAAAELLDRLRNHLGWSG